MTLDRVLSRPSNILHEELDGEVLVVNLTTMQTIALNEHGILVWNLFDGQRSVGEVINTLVDAYPDQADTIKADVLGAVDSLESSGLLAE